MATQRRNPRHERYTPLTVELELGWFTRNRDDWPSWTEFEQAGLKGLRKAVDRFGGGRHWARRIGKRYHARPGPPPWSEERIVRELDQIAPTLEAWPSSREWERMGMTPLRDAMRRHGGTRRWARRYGFHAHNARWDDQLIEDELRAFIGPGSNWPARAEFERAGRASLYGMVTAHPLGPAGWAKRLGVPHPHARRRRARTPGS